MSRTASMPKSRAGGLRNLFLILSIEIAFVVGLHALGSLERMQIDFSNFSQWLDVTSPEVALTVSIRMLALVIAYWVLTTSAIYMIARTLKIPAMLKLMEITTLPFVRKAIDGALAATILGSSVFGGASAVFAKQDASKIQSSASATQSVKDYRHLYNPVAAEDGPQVIATNQYAPSTEGEVPVTLDTPSSNTTGGVNASPASNSFVPVPAEDVEKPAPKVEAPVEVPTPAETTKTTTSTTLPKVEVPVTPSTQVQVTPTTQAPATPKTEVPVVPSTPKVTVPNTTPTPQPVPSPGVVVEGERVQRPSSTTQTPQQTQTVTASSHTVVSGDSFWNIAKAQVQKSLGREPTNSEVANYWVKLVDANKGNLRSGDADLIFAGEVFSLPSI